MRATLPAHLAPQPKEIDAAHNDLGFNSEVLLPLFEESRNSIYLAASTIGEFNCGEALYQIPRFVFLGDAGGGDTIRLAILAGVYGNDAEGVEAVVKFVLTLLRRPALAREYHLFVYPVVNPLAFADGANNGPLDALPRQLWHKSNQPGVYYLERELGVIQFHGVISIQGNSEDRQFKVKISRPSLLDPLAQPALEAANRWLPGISPARRAQADSSARGYFTLSDEIKGSPFEIILEPPRQESRQAQINSAHAALIEILEKYRETLSFRQNI